MFTGLLVALRRVLFQPEPPSVLRVFAALHQVSPRARRTRMARLPVDHDRHLLGCAYSSGLTEVYTERQDPVEVLITAIHEWAHLQRQDGRHDRAFAGALLTQIRRLEAALGIAVAVPAAERGDHKAIERRLRAALLTQTWGPMRPHWRKGSWTKTG